MIDRLIRPCRLAIGSALFVALAVATPGSAQAQLERQLDHFKCYVASGDPVSPNVAEVELVDQFDVAMNITEKVKILEPLRFCNPVAKGFSGTVSDIVSKTNHLTFYQFVSLLASPGAPLPPPVAGVVKVANQFGKQSMQFETADILAVPTRKNDLGKWQRLDHFKCYFAFGKPVEVVVQLEDQFELRRHKVVEPLLFCNPVEKFPFFGEPVGIVNPDGHLVCYKISSGDFKAREVVIANQFTPAVAATFLKLGPADLLCVPSLKLGFRVK